jgi:uncharacterized protein (DUF1499 family)
MKYGKAFLLLACAAALLHCSGGQAAPLGVTDSHLGPCPQSPNCVSSQGGDAEHFIDPITYQGAAEQSRSALLDVLRSMPRARVVEATDRYIHVEFTSAVLRFVDDVEFFFDDAAPRIQVRSASRVGYSDLGVNRKRVETIRSLLRRRLEKDSVR